MIVAVFYDPADGRILQTATAAQAALDADPRPWVEVPEFRFDYDVTHRVEAGALVAIEGADHG